MVSDLDEEILRMNECENEQTNERTKTDSIAHLYANVYVMFMFLWLDGEVQKIQKLSIIMIISEYYTHYLYRIYLKV